MEHCWSLQASGLGWLAAFYGAHSLMALKGVNRSSVESAVFWSL
jgi:hypothetical protein